MPKYPDGLYKVIVTAYSYPLENVASISSTTSRNVIIDNFRPYLESVSIFDVISDTTPVYSRSWTFDGTLLNSPAVSVERPFAPGHQYNLTAVFSESMATATLTIDGFGVTPLSKAAGSSIYSTTYMAVFTVPEDITGDAVKPLAFAGKDLAGTLLLELTTA